LQYSSDLIAAGTHEAIEQSRRSARESPAGRLKTDIGLVRVSEGLGKFRRCQIFGVEAIFTNFS
jgi:hypothetical protein